MAETILLTDPHHNRADVAMIRTAIRRKWKIPDAAFEALPGLVLQLATDKNQKAEIRLKAVSLVQAMHDQNSNGKREAKKPEGVIVNVGVSIDQRRSRITEICRTAIERGGVGGDRAVDGGGSGEPAE